MEIREIDRFNELAESCGNRYAAIKLVSKWARDFGIEFKDCHILESRLIQWVITGKCPYVEEELQKRRIVPNEDKINEVLCWVSDKSITNEVRYLYKESVHHRRLLTCNNNKLSKGQISRVNVLLRMTWFYTSNKEKGE